MSTPIIFAHRGAPLLAPENTLAAFSLAYKLGARAIECDVQCSADFVPLIIHDDTLDRTTTGKGRVAAHTAKEIDSLSAGAWFNQRFSQQRVPRLVDLLSFLRPLNVYINLEIKPNELSVVRLVEEIFTALAQKKFPKERILLSSFNYRVIELLAQYPPGSIPHYALLIHTETQAADAIDFAKKNRCFSIHPKISLLKKIGTNFIKQCHTAGLAVYSFTLNNAEEIQFFVEAGLNGFFTDCAVFYSAKPQKTLDF